MSHKDKTVRKTGSYELFCKGESVKEILLEAGTKVHRTGKQVLVFYNPKNLDVILKFKGINPTFSLAED